MLKKRVFGMMTVLAAVILVFGLVACGGNGNDGDDGEGTGGNPVLAASEIWADDFSVPRGILFDGNASGGNVYEYFLAGGTWIGGSKEGIWSGNTITYNGYPARTFTVSGNKLYEYFSGSSVPVASYTRKTGQTIDSPSGDGDFPSASKLAEYGLEGFTLPAGVTAQGWDEYTNQLYIDINSATDPRPAIGTWLSANGWSGSGNSFSKGLLTLSLNYESGTWYSIEVNK